MRRMCHSLFIALIATGSTAAPARAQGVVGRPLLGYADAFSVQPSETIRFMVSSDAPEFRADLVRLIHGDTNPLGPGFREELISTAPINRTYPGRQQALRSGSCVLIPDDAALRLLQSFTLQAWIYPTTPDKGVQGIITRWSDDGGGYALILAEDGSLGLWLGGDGKEMKVSTGRTMPVYLRAEKAYPLGDPLHSSHWYFVAATFDADTGEVRLYQEPRVAWPGHPSAAVVTHSTALTAVGDAGAPLVIGAFWEGGTTHKPLTWRHFNGKIGHPRLYDRSLGEEEIRALRESEEAPAGALAVWDFALDIESREVTDLSPNHLHGRTLNMPRRAFTAHNWSGTETDFKRALSEYGAIHFHDDDLDDARWEVDFEYRVPSSLRSGAYAARLRAADEVEDYIPFFVRPPAGTHTSDIAFLAPTFSYLAYANMDSGIPQLLSLYDKHSDGSGVSYSSRLRPIVNFRPKLADAWEDVTFPHQFNADLHLTGWLEEKGYTYDVITDEDLHWEGTSLLAPYRVILTGSHPEYWSGQMLDALKAYLEGGGRLMYLGGNGFYWVTGMDPEERHTVEIRRWGGTQTWEAQPGEFYLSTSGEMGGLWRFRGRPPQQLVGVGFTAQGPAPGVPYKRQPDSFDPRAAFIFEGIDDDELIGDFPNLVMSYGAANFELDRFDLQLGTPPHALLLATGTGLPDGYKHVIEQIYQSNLGTVDSLVKADMVYFEYPRGGAVFSTGAIGWDGCLSYNGYDNNVSRITDNILRRFVSHEPLPAMPPE